MPVLTMCSQNRISISASKISNMIGLEYTLPQAQPDFLDLPAVSAVLGTMFPEALLLSGGKEEINTPPYQANPEFLTYRQSVRLWGLCPLRRCFCRREGTRFRIAPYQGYHHPISRLQAVKGGFGSCTWVRCFCRSEEELYL
jgi:hypothetical protein